MNIPRIAVAGRKGGVGKTTISCGIASVFASQNKRVLVVDLDPQSNAALAEINVIEEKNKEQGADKIP